MSCPLLSSLPSLNLLYLWRLYSTPTDHSLHSSEALLSTKPLLLTLSAPLFLSLLREYLIMYCTPTIIVCKYYSIAHRSLFSPRRRSIISFSPNLFLGRLEWRKVDYVSRYEDKLLFSPRHRASTIRTRETPFLLVNSLFSSLPRCDSVNMAKVSSHSLMPLPR